MWALFRVMIGTWRARMLSERQRSRSLLRLEYAVRPFQANNTTTMGAVSATQDNNLVNTTSFAVTVASAPGINGTLLQFTAIQVTP